MIAPMPEIPDMPIKSLTSGNGTSDFVSELGHQMRSLRHALAGLLEQLGSPDTPTRLQRQLGVAYTVCWQIFRIVQAGDVADEARNAPSPGALKGLLAAARTCGAGEETIAGVAAAADRYRRFVRTHAEDRRAFESMVVAATAEPTAEKVLLERRRAAYRAVSHVWGVQTDLQCATMMIRRSAKGDTTDTLSVFAQRGIRRLRADAHVTLMGYHVNPAATFDPKDNLLMHQAVDVEAAARFGLPILPQFSSQPLPDVKVITLPSGWRIYNLAGNDVGLRANIDCTTAYTINDIPEMADRGRWLNHVTVSCIRKPVALLVMDLLLHRASFPGAEIQQAVYQYQEGDMSQDAVRQAQSFAGDERIACLGPADTASLVELPRYGEMLRFASGKVGWSLADFDVYRLKMSYPMMGTAARMFFYDPAR